MSWPNSVSRAPCLPRVSTRAPSLFSILWMLLERAGCEMPISVAARLNEPRCAIESRCIKGFTSQSIHPTYGFITLAYLTRIDVRRSSAAKKTSKKGAATQEERLPQGLPNHVHLVGSVGLDSVEEVFRTTGRVLGRRLKRVPDGEPGPRRLWVSFQYPLLRSSPFLRPDPSGAV